MSPQRPTRATGDFGYPKRPVSRTQIVAIYDLVGFTTLESNRDLVRAVRDMETALDLVLAPDFNWGHLGPNKSDSPVNDILLRSTGDGYVLAFSQDVDDRKALDAIASIHKEVTRHYEITAGVNKGQLYVVSDTNERTNIIGWGINLAARALSIAKPNQIVCTSHYAQPMINADNALSHAMRDIGTHSVKHGDEIHLFNYYKRGEYGAPETARAKRKRSTARRDK